MIRLALAIVLASAVAVPQLSRPSRPEPPQVGSGAVTGVVVDGSSGAPVAGAVVYASIGGSDMAGARSRQLTDSQGRFAILDLPASERLALSASKPGYLDGGYSAGDLPGTSSQLIALADGEWVSGVRVELWKPGVIAGRVLDEIGEPVVDVYVRLLAAVRVSGHEYLAAGPFTMTDDRGRYRIAGLTPARYYVSVPSLHASVPATTPVGEIPSDVDNIRARTPRETGRLLLDTEAGARLIIGPYPVPPPSVDDRPRAYPIAFFPAGTNVAGASPIDLGFGETRDGVDVQLTPLPASSISGRVEGLGLPIAGLTLRLLARGLEGLGPGSETATARVAPDGTFTFAGVPAGEYTIEASRSTAQLQFGRPSALNDTRLPRSPGSWGRMSRFTGVSAGPKGTTLMSVNPEDDGLEGRTAVSVGNADVTDVVVTMRPLTTISGRVLFEEDPNRPQVFVNSMILTADPADGDPKLGRPEGRTNRYDESKSFNIRGLRAGKYFLRSVIAGLPLKSVVYQGRDYTHRPFDAAAMAAFDGVVVTVTVSRATLEGVVRGRDGEAAPGAEVVAFPVDRTLWVDPGIEPPNIRSATATNTGTFRIPILPAGEYYLVAVPAGEGTWAEAGFFERVAPQATRVTLDWGQSVSIDLTVSR